MNTKIKDMTYAKYKNPPPKKVIDIFAIISVILLALYAASLIFALLWAFMSSLKGRYDLFDFPFSFPKKIKWNNYIVAFKELKQPVEYGAGTRNVYMPELFLNTLLYSLGSTFFATLSPCITAYATAKYKFKLRGVIYAIVIITMLLPIVGSLPSEMQIVRAIGFYDNLVGIWIMKGSFLGMNFLIFYASFKSFSWDFAEAAFIDGASHLKVLTKIMMPLARTTIFAIALLVFIGFWNEYQTQLIYLPSMPSLAYALFSLQFSVSQVMTVPIQLAGCMIVSIPIFILYMCFKNLLIGNLAVGGIKG